MINVDYQSILKKSSIAHAYHRVIYNKEGEAVDYEFIDVNFPFEKLIGLKAKDIIGKKVSQVFSQVLMDDFNWVEIYRNIHSNDDINIEEYYFKPLDTWYRVFSYSPEKSYFITVFYNIPKDLQKISEDNSYNFQKFFDLSLDLLCISHIDGKFIKVNLEWEKIFGYNIEELKKFKYLDFVHSEDLEGTKDEIIKLFRQKEVINFINRYRCKDGVYRFIEWRAKPDKKYIYITARDITTRMENERENKEKNRG